MRFVDRSAVPVPTELSADPFRRMREAYLRYLSLDPKERAQTRPPDRHLPPSPSLLPPLNALFHGKCAFCESPSDKLSVYRFRPTADALPMDEGDPQNFLHYGWLADAWQNLYPICPDCRPSQMNHFPVEGRRATPPDPKDYEAYARANDGVWPDPTDESTLLLDPCTDRDLGQHFKVLADAYLDPLTERGRETIEHFRLNRIELVGARMRVLDALSAGEVPAPETPFAGIAAIAATQEAPPAASAARREQPAPATAPAWHLTSFEITAYKALDHVTLDMPPAPEDGTTPALLILGENATGKSSFLEAIALAMLPDKGRKDLGIDPGPLLLDPRYLGASWLKARKEAGVTLTFTADHGETLTRSLTLTPGGITAKGPLPEGLPVFAYGAYRHFLKDYHRWRASRPVLSLFKSDDLISNPERWLLELSETRFDMVVRALRIIIGGGFSILYRDHEAGRIYVVTKRDGVENNTPLSTVSSGFRTILALTCDVMRWLMRDKGFESLGLARAVVLIDEVEAHLHPRWKVAIMDGLRRALPNVTFIVTTHDPLCLRGMRDGEVMVLSRVAGEVAGSDLPVTVETLTALPDVTRLTVEQLLTSDLFDLFDTDDPVAGRDMAELVDALSGTGDMDPGRRADLLAKFRAEVSGALPVGSTEVSRLVQEAVAEYLKDRAKAPVEARAGLREATRARIKAALGGDDARG